MANELEEKRTQTQSKKEKGGEEMKKRKIGQPSL